MIPPIVKQQLNNNTIILLGKGWSYQDVSNALLLDEETLRNYQEQYRRAGLAELLTDGRQGSECRLTEAQQKILENELESSIFAFFNKK